MELCRDGSNNSHKKRNLPVERWPDPANGDGSVGDLRQRWRCGGDHRVQRQQARAGQDVGSDGGHQGLLLPRADHRQGRADVFRGHRGRQGRSARTTPSATTKVGSLARIPCCTRASKGDVKS
ncbi:hypothetical protein MRX96_043541 [Rhipicephalus microplus]